MLTGTTQRLRELQQSIERVIRGKPEAASDVFALCATLFALGSGHHPFGDREDVSALRERLLAGAIAPWPGSPRLGALLAQGMAKRPRDRPGATALRQALLGLT